MSLAANINLLAQRTGNALRDLVMPRLLPAGGAVGQVLAKTAATDFAAAWQTPASGASTVVQVDFGSVALQEKLFVVAVPGATLGAKVQATPSLDMPAGVALDELEMNPLSALAAVTAADTVTLIVASLRGPVWGKRNINLTLG